MTRKTLIRYGCVILLAVLLAVAPVVSGADLYAVDHDHGLATDDAKDTYQSQGVATGNVYGLDASLTVADTAEGVGLPDWKYVSTGATYLQIDYNEDIERTLRIHVPQEYFTPRLKQDLEAAESDLTADFEPSDNGNYTVVTVTVDEPTTAVFRVPWHRGAVAESRDRLSEFVNETTGFSLPSIAGSEDDWQYIEQGALSTNTTYALQTNESQYTIQYDADASQSTEQWLTVRSCDSTDDAPVCTFEKAGQPNKTYLLSKSSTPPQIRFKTGGSSVSSIQSSINDLQEAVDAALADVSSWLPGSESDGGGD